MLIGSAQVICSPKSLAGGGEPLIGNWGPLPDAGEESMNDPDRAGKFAFLDLKLIFSTFNSDTVR